MQYPPLLKQKIPQTNKQPNQQPTKPTKPTQPTNQRSNKTNTKTHKQRTKAKSQEPWPT